MRKRSLLGMAAILAAVALGATALAFTNSGGYTVDRTKATPAEIAHATACLARVNDGVKCATTMAEEALITGKVQVYFDQLTALRAGSNQLVAACHQVVHEFGRKLAEEIGLDRAFALPYPDCQFAFYHGVMWSYTEDMDYKTVIAHVDSMCEPFIKRGGIDNDATRDCVHGIGHLLWQRAENGSLEQAFDGCTNLSDEEFAEPCAIGAAMELEFTAIELKVTGGITPEELAVTEKALNARGIDEIISKYTALCQKQTSSGVASGCVSGLLLTAFDLWNSDTKRAFALCENFTGLVHTQCYTYTGATAIQRGASAGRNGWDPAKIASLCQAYEPSAQRCIDLASYSIYRISPDLANELCRVAETPYRKGCVDAFKMAVEYADEMNTALGIKD